MGTRLAARSAQVAAFATCLVVAAAAPAQNVQNFQKVRFETPDGVEIQGFWYPSVRNAPVVILLHDLGKNKHCRRAEWNNLATKLQNAGYAVLAFDFRGHGGSTTVVNARKFVLANSRYGATVKNNGTIDLSKVKIDYGTVLVNDIAAAKAFLDIKNDGGECNTSAVTLIGAGKGATLGALWAKSEWYRYRYYPIQTGLGVQWKRDDEPFGRSVAAMVWLSMPHIKGTIYDAKNIPALASRAVLAGTPTTFVFNVSDPTQKKVANHVIKQLKLNDKAKKANPKLKYIGVTSLKSNPAFTGRELLNGPTVSGLIGWLDTLKREALFRPWMQQNFQQGASVWQIGARVIPANVVGDTNFKFIDYRVFLRLP